MYMGDNYKRSQTTHTSYRLPQTTKNKLDQLAEFYGTTRTETLKRLINQHYSDKLAEIKTFREIRDSEQKADIEI
jgi:predicted DNA-binding protein